MVKPLVRCIWDSRSLVLAVVSAALLSACAGDDMADLKSYVATVKARPAGRIPPLPAFETYVTVPYAAAHLRDPFMQFMVAAEPTETAQPQVQQSNIHPPRTHKSEPLEKFPLDGLKFVGLLERQGERWAIIMAPDKLVHRVKVGNYLGQNYGKIVSISETKIELVETISNGMGGWVESPATLGVVE